MTGPACAHTLEDSQTNQCYRTAPGTQGYIDVGSTGNDANNGGTDTQPTNPESTNPPDTVTGEIGSRCGNGWSDANSRCSTPCPSQTDNECSNGETCFADLTLACPSDNSNGSEDPVNEGSNNLSQ